MATISSVALPALGYGLQSAPRKTKVVAPYTGFVLGSRISVADRLAMAVQNSRRRRRRTGGGALSARCSAASEIFRIAAIMNGLVLIGVAVGFVLLRVETALEESE
jgi:PetM family of cytochrome b6f complex subunit 7